MRRKWNRFVAGLLSIIMLVTMLPMEVLAAGNGGRAEQPSQTMPFQDVKSSDWCAKAVEYVYSHGIFNGTSTATFSPSGTMTRGMFVTVLGRMAGVNPDDYSGETPFSDVPQTMYYAPYVQWAARYGITVGTGDGKFSPDAFINRAQMAAFFVRYFEAFQVDYATGANVTTTPADLERTPAYAQDAVLKLWKQGLLNGDGTRFAPEGNATRAQMAMLCMRADEAVEIWYSAPGIVGRKSGETPQKEDQSKPNSGSNSSGSSSSGGSSGGNGSGSTAHTITLYLPDGTTSTFTQTTSALSLANLPTPSVAGKAFVGWYYDESYNKAVADGDPLSENLSLYAKMVDYDAIEGVETPTYAGATDVGLNFTIRVNSDSESDLTGKISLIGTEQPTSEVDADGNTILVVGSVRNNHDGTYTVAPPAGGWAEGGTYKVVLEDNSLYFNGEASSVREYHFTVKVGDPVLNWHLREEVKSIPATAIGNATQNGRRVKALSMPVAALGSGGTAMDAVSDSTGTFVYNGDLAVGDTVAIYEGTEPEKRVAVGTTDANTGDVSYVKITGVNKTTNTYSYQSAAVEDVLFVPDVLPVKASRKTAKEENPSNDYTILVPVEELTFTAASSVGNLDENTTIDVGDFLAFYTGESYTIETAASDGYGRITAVDYTTDELGSDYYQLTYTDATKDDVLSSMDVDTTDPISGDAMLNGVDTEKLEKQIARQAIESGFAQTVADRISGAIDEMNLSGLTAGDEIDLRSIDIDPEGTLGISTLSLNDARGSGAVSPARANANGGGKTSVKVKSAQITKKLQNFTDASGNPLSGVRLELQLEVTKEIQKDGGDIVITVTPTFIQELKLDLSTHGKLVWKHKFIFYWISDVYLEAGLNVYTYTAINLDATVVSQGEKDTVTKVKDLVNKLGKKLDALEGKDTGGEREEIDTSKLSLQELYNSMLELDSDWVELYRKQIFSMKKTVAKIIKFELTVDFVVELNIRMAMGMNFNYTNAKRYVFGVYIFKHRTTTRTYNLVNEQYNLRLYAMGAVGLRAGVEIWPSVSLISRKVATVGIVAKLGAYLKGYGYVLYALHYEAGKPKTSNASGALYVEVGMFMDISANLSAFKGKVSWTPEIYTDETPLWSAGSTHAITAFKMENADGEEDTPTVYLKNGGLDVVLPQSVQALTGFDLTTGNDRTETYDWNKFDISFDDPRFTTYRTGPDSGNYSQQYVKLNLSDWQNCNEPEIDCVMTLTYKGSDLSFSTTPVQLKVKVHWDRLKDGYPIHELSSTGGYIGWEQRKFREPLNLKTPDRTGYEFTGWTYYLLKNESNIFSYTEADRYDGTTMPESALVAVAMFEPQTVPYTLNFYLQNEDGTYPETPTESVVYRGTADEYIAPDKTKTLVPDKIGYRHPGYAGIHIRPDGTGGQNYYYSRAPYTLTLRNDGQVSTVPYRYGDQLDRLNDAPTRLGYIFDGWYTDETYQNAFTATTMPAKDFTLYAKWVPVDINYFLVLRKEGADGKWTQATKIQTGKTDETVPIDPAKFLTEAENSIYTIPKPMSYKVNAEDGGTVSISYARKRYKLTYNLNTADAAWVSDPGVKSYRLGAALKLLTQSYVTRAGYTFDGWYTDANCTTAFTATTMPDHDVTLYAKWTAQGGISYTVEHYQQNVTDDEYTLAETESKTGATGQLTAAGSKSYPGFTAPQSITQQIVKGDGSTVVQVYYTRNEYTLTYNLNGSGASWTDSAENKFHTDRYGAGVTHPSANDLSRAGYAFGGWYTDEACTSGNEFTATTMPAENTPLYAKWNAGEVNYTVNYYLQNVDGTTYPDTPSETVSGSGVTGQTVNVQKSFKGFVPKADSSTSITLKADSAQNVADIYYTRNQYMLTFKLGDGVTLDKGCAPNDGSIYYGAEISTDMTNAKRTGYTFVGWYEDEACQTEWSGTTMPACDLTLYAKWDTMTYFLRFDWDGNVPLRDWLLENGGKLLTAAYDEENGVYSNANDHGIPYIEVSVKYDQVFTLPTGIPGTEYFGYYKEALNQWGNPTETFVKVEDTKLTQMAAEQGAIVKVGVQWKSETDSNGTELLYNANDFLTKVVQDYSSEAASYALGVDLDLCYADTTRTGDIVGGITFDGNNHTIYHAKRGEAAPSQSVGTIYGYGDNVTVKNLTIDGMTVDYTATVSSPNAYHAFGALAGFVGDGFTAESVTVKNVTMNLNLLGEEGNAYISAHLLPAECIGGFIGYAKGTVTLTNCNVEDLTVNVTDINDNRGTQFLIGGLIGYADALYTQIPGENEYSSSNDYNGNGSVTITACTVLDMTVDKNGATGASVGGFLGGIGKHVVSKTGAAYSVTTTIDEVSAFPEGFESIGKELAMNDSTASNSAARSLDAMPAAAFEDESDEENTAA